MTDFNFGALITKFTEIFAIEIPVCDKVKCIIDNQFETYTRDYLLKQLTWFMVMYVIPYFTLAYSSLQGAV